MAHKRTFFFLEQLILKHGADEACVNVKEMHEVRAPWRRWRGGGVDGWRALPGRAERVMETRSGRQAVDSRR